MRNLPSHLFPAICLIGFCITLMVACSQDESLTEESPAPLISQEEIASLLNEYNTKLASVYEGGIPSIINGFTATGELEIALMNDHEDNPALAYLFHQKDPEGSVISRRRFDFGLEMPIEIPAVIEEAQIVFIGNQLIVIDLKSRNQTNFFVQSNPSVQNKTPDIRTISGNYLGTETVEGITKTFNRLCLCRCLRCSNPDICGTESCECSCGGSACTTTCRDNYEATCKKMTRAACQ